MIDPVENWLRLAEYDLAAAETMLASGQTLYVVFTCQQAVEKALKAVVTKQTGAHPHRTHDQSFIAVRYPLDLDEANAAFSQVVVAPLVPEAREFVKWVRSLLS